jgi:alpha(1,3/1,4) fucosyltransferase
LVKKQYGLFLDEIYEIRGAFSRLGYTPIFTNTLKNLKNFDRLVCYSCLDSSALQLLKQYPKEKMIIFLWEPPTFSPFSYSSDLHELFSKVYTWDDSLVDNVRYFHCYYPRCFPMIDSVVPFSDKKLCVMVNAKKKSAHKYSLYAERENVVQFFEHNHSEDFDLYGLKWGNLGLKNYRGVVESKTDCIKNYKFCYTYENMRSINGYVTEKIFDVFRAGCVPIYWGAENINYYVQKNCFIDRRDFKDDEQLYQFLKNMREEEYLVYISNIRTFLQSPQALIFSSDYCVDIFLNAIEPGYDKMVALTEQQRANLVWLYEYLNRFSLD